MSVKPGNWVEDRMGKRWLVIAKRHLFGRMNAFAIIGVDDETKIVTEDEINQMKQVDVLR